MTVWPASHLAGHLGHLVGLMTAVVSPLVVAAKAALVAPPAASSLGSAPLEPQISVSQILEGLRSVLRHRRGSLSAGLLGRGSQTAPKDALGPGPRGCAGAPCPQSDP